MIAGNPFPEADYDRWYIWQMLVTRDIEAFLSQDWAMVADDFINGQFTGIDGCHSDNPDDWKFKFPDVEPYKVEWLKQAESFNKTEWAEDPEAALYRVTELLDIEINNNAALVHKKFRGNMARADGQKTTFNWQSLYYCREVNGIWKITGFTGYIPLVEDSAKFSSSAGKQVPENSSQH